MAEDFSPTPLYPGPSVPWLPRSFASPSSCTLYEGPWRYTGIWDPRNIIGEVFTSTFLFYLLLHGVFGLTTYPRSIFAIDALLLVVLLGGIRLGRRVYREMGHLDREKRVLIYGAGNAEEMIPGSGPGQACGT